MSTLRHLTESVWAHPVTLIYATRTPDDVIFRDELAAIERRHPDFRLHLLPTMADEGWQGSSGFLTPELLRAFAPDIARARAHVCGPTPMMAAVVPMLTSLGVAEGAIHTESFVSLASEPGPGADVTLTFVRSGKTVVARRGEGLIRVAEANGIAIDYSCRNGECGSCRCRLLAGEVAMPGKTALTSRERRSGLILACVARPVSNAITLDL